jgi:hypothetical protein
MPGGRVFLRLYRFFGGAECSFAARAMNWSGGRANRLRVHSIADIGSAARKASQEDHWRQERK